MPPDPNLVVHEVFSWVVRLERIEAAVDAIAIEIERISEAQRFSARLQSEQQPPRLQRPGESPASPG